MNTLTPPNRSAEEQARLDATLTDLFEHRICFNQTLGMTVASLQPDAPALRLEMRPDLIGHALQGRLHGGVIATALDTVGGLALMLAMAAKHPDETTEQLTHRFGRIGTIDLRVDYLRQGQGRYFVASGEVTRLGGRVGATRMQLINHEGTLIATAAAAYIIS